MVDEWTERALIVMTDALTFYVQDSRRILAALNELVEERPDQYEVVSLRDWLSSAGEVFVDQISRVQSSLMK